MDNEILTLRAVWLFVVFVAISLLTLLTRFESVIADEDKRTNAIYIISIARKLGCSVFLLWDDIVEVSFSLEILVLQLMSGSGNDFGDMRLIFRWMSP